MWKMLLLLVATLTTSQVFAMDSLSELRWNKRAVLIFGQSDDPQVIEQTRRLERQKRDLEDRDMVLIRISSQDAAVIYGDAATPDADPLRKEAGVQDGFQILLVGKDGGVKFQSRTVVDNIEIFGLIDRMPMRRAEKDRAK